jgi:phosphopantothenate synthetase
MDPLSSALAFTGLDTSLITIVDTILKVSTKLLELRRKFKDASRNILELHRDLQNLRALVTVIQAPFSGDGALNCSSSLPAIARASSCN